MAISARLLCCLWAFPVRLTSLVIMAGVRGAAGKVHIIMVYLPPHQRSTRLLTRRQRRWVSLLRLHNETCGWLSLWRISEGITALTLTALEVFLKYHLPQSLDPCHIVWMGRTCLHKLNQKPPDFTLACNFPIIRSIPLGYFHCLLAFLFWGNINNSNYAQGIQLKSKLCPIIPPLPSQITQGTAALPFQKLRGPNMSSSSAFILHLTL